jgi:hypothetical protein
MKKIMVIVSLSMFIVMSSAWAQLINLPAGNRPIESRDEGANLKPGQNKLIPINTSGRSRLSTGLRINTSGQNRFSSGLRINHGHVLPDEVIHSSNEFQGESVMPAIFAYHCNNHDPDVQNCGGHTVPYGNNLFTDVHFTHTWFQIMNTSGFTFTSDNTKMIIEVYGKDGNLIDVNGGPGWHNNGIIDLLDDGLAGADGFTPKESIFFYFDTWMHDEYADKNPPYSAKLFVYTKMNYETNIRVLTLSIHVGWEEIIEDDDGQRYAKGGTLIDKETVYLQSPKVVEEQTEHGVIELLQ